MRDSAALAVLLTLSVGSGRDLSLFVGFGWDLAAFWVLVVSWRYSLALAWLWRISGSGWAGKLSDSLVGLSELSVGLGYTGEATRWLWSYSSSRLWLCYGAIRCFGYGSEASSALAGPGRYPVGLVGADQAHLEQASPLAAICVLLTGFLAHGPSFPLVWSKTPLRASVGPWQALDAQAG